MLGLCSPPPPFSTLPSPLTQQAQAQPNLPTPATATVDPQPQEAAPDRTARRLQRKKEKKAAKKAGQETAPSAQATEVAAAGSSCVSPKADAPACCMATGAGHVEKESGKDSAPAPPASSSALDDSIATAAGEAELDMVDVSRSTVDALAGREEAPAPAPTVETEEPLRGEHIMPDAVETLMRVLEGPTQADQIWGNRIGAYVLECKVRVGGWVERGGVGSGRIEMARRWR